MSGFANINYIMYSYIYFFAFADQKYVCHPKQKTDMDSSWSWGFQKWEKLLFLCLRIRDVTRYLLFLAALIQTAFILSKYRY